MSFMLNDTHVELQGDPQLSKLGTTLKSLFKESTKTTYFLIKFHYVQTYNKRK